MTKQPVSAASIRQFINEQVTQSFLDQHGANACALGTNDNAPCLTLYVDVETGANQKQLGVNKVANSTHFNDPVTGQQLEIPIRYVAAGATHFDKQAGNAVQELVPGGVGINVLGEGLGEPANLATLGGWAWDQVHHCLVFLSNAHVLGTDDDRNVFYPAIGGPNEPFGRAKRGIMHRDKKNKVDAAIGDVHEPSRVALKVKELGPAIMTIGDGQVGDAVQKMGYATNRTEGTIVCDTWTGSIQDLAKRNHFFGPCFLIDPGPDAKWADEGDSGSLVFAKQADGTRAVVGLHFGHQTKDGRNFGIACPIQAVFTELNITTLPNGVLESIVESAAGTKGKAFADMMQVLVAFRGVCATTPQGRRVLSLLDTHQLALVSALATDADLRTAAAGVLRALFGGVARLGAAMVRPLSHEVVEKIREFGESLREKDDDLRPAVDACLDDLPKTPEDTTLKEILNVPILAGNL